MKAVYFDAHGGLDVLRYGDVPDPEPAPGEVVLRIEAAALNHNDLWARKGLPGIDVPLPHISGTDAAGVVVALGAGVTTLKRGDEVIVYPIQSCRVCATCLAGDEMFCRQMRVWGFQTGPYIGSYAQYARVQAAQCLPRPAHLSWTEAAATTGALVSVWRMLVTRANTRPGEHVLIFGASGGTGSFAIQLVKALGAIAIAVASSDEKERFCFELGADHVIRSDRQDVRQEVRRITEKRGVEVVFDHVGATTWETGIESLRWGGRLVICGATEGYTAKTDLRFLWNKQLSLLGSHGGSHRDWVDALRLMSAIKMRPAVTQTFSLQDVPEAQRRMEAREIMGKIAVNVSGSL